MSSPRKRKAVSYKEVIEHEVDEESAYHDAEAPVNKKPAIKNPASTYIDSSVRKEFPPHGTFSGKVTSFDEDENLYQVTYEDGDQEEYTEEELLVILAQDGDEMPVFSGGESSLSSKRVRLELTLDGTQ